MQKAIVKKILVLSICLGAFLQPAVALASGGSSLGANKIDSFDVPKTDVSSILGNAVSWLLGLAGILAIGAIIWGGFTYIASVGDEGKTATAKKIIIYAVMGLVVIGLSFLIIDTVKGVITAPEPQAGESTAAFTFGSGAYSTLTNLLKADSSGFTQGIAGAETEAGQSGLRTTGDIKDIIISLISILTGLVAVIAVGAIIFGGVMYITSFGDEGKSEKAKKIILYAVIGLIIIALAGIIVNVVINQVN